MNDIKRPESYNRGRQYSAARPVFGDRSEHGGPLYNGTGPGKSTAAPSGDRPAGTSLKIRFRLPQWRRSRAARILRRAVQPLRITSVRVGLIASAALIIVVQLIIIVQPYLVQHSYALGSAGALLEHKDALLADKLVYNAAKNEFDFNANFNPATQPGSASGGPQISATAYDDATKGLTVTDPHNQIDFKITPKFGLLPGRQDGNRIVYPLADGTGWLVYTMQATGVKEDILLSHANGDTMNLNYQLDLGANFVARTQEDGSVGIFGSDSPITGNVSTSTDKDAKLLLDARKKAPKNKLFFSLPAPIAYGPSKAQVALHARYDMKGSELRTLVSGLKAPYVRYPLTIDPTVTVTSSADLFRDTNPDSNADFNASSGNISRGAVTGGVVPAWSSVTHNLSTARFLAGTTIYDDYAYVAGGAGAGSTSNLTSIEFARLDSADQDIGSWSSTTALPTGLSRFVLLAYNGYLYAIGGSTSDTTCTTRSSTIYYNRIQINGQLSANWSTSTLPTAVCGLGAMVYNNVMYIAGGRTGAAANTGVTTVAHATINPDGSIPSFTTDSSMALPAPRYDADLRIYNGYAYVIGGNLNGTLTNTVIYAPLASDGSIYVIGTGWKGTSNFGTSRSNMGATFTATNDGYMYVNGGCNTFNGNQQCTGIQSEVQTAQINADGTLGPWSDISTAIVTLTRVGAGFFQWRGTVYSFGGCSAATTTGTNISCISGNTLNTSSYSTIKSPGEVGPVNTTTNLPVGDVVWAHGSVIYNGFIYVVGGCITLTCETGSGDTTGKTSFAALAADGTIGSWTTDSTHLLNGATGLAAFGMAVYDGYLYATGGYTTGGASRNVFYIQLNANGTLNTGGWTTQTNKLANSTYYNSAVAYHGFLFVFGGCTGTTGSAGCSAYRAFNYRMPITGGGAPGTSTASTAGSGTFASLPTGTGLMAAAMYNGYIYLCGGANGTSGQTTTVYYARVQDNGNISPWNTSAVGLVHTLRRADAIAMNGYLYVIGGHNGNTPATTYGDIEIVKLNLSTGDLVDDGSHQFTNSVIQITPRWDERTVFSNGYIYASGGCSVGNPPNTCTTVSNAMEYFEVYNAGNKGTGAWANNSNVYSTNRTYAATTVYNGYIYVAGGCTTYTIGASYGADTCTATTTTVAYAQLNPDGSIGAWTTSGQALITTPNIAIAQGCLVGLGGSLYLIGGVDTGDVTRANSSYSPIGAGGDPSGWVQVTNGVPSARGLFGCAVFNSRIYVVGGLNNSSGSNVYSPNTYYSPQLTNGGDITGNWGGTGSINGSVNVPVFTTGRERLSAVIAGGYLYVMGGDDGTNALQDVQYIRIDPSTGGAVGSWAFTNDLPVTLSSQMAFAANGYVYVMGGRTAVSTCNGNASNAGYTYIASINNTGRLSSWSQGVNNFTTARFGASYVFNNGYYYLLGGHSCTAILSSNIIQYGGEQSQAMKTLISKYADFAGNGSVYSFVAYLTNAVNNGVDIEQWRLQYEMSMEATNSWGVKTAIYPISSQAKNNVFSYDGSGTDVKLARWAWLSFDIDMYQSYTFTDDVQPTIFQYELYYAPPPAKRLIHGKDFRDQTQQDLDTHPS